MQNMILLFQNQGAEQIANVLKVPGVMSKGI